MYHVNVDSCLAGYTASNIKISSPSCRPAKVLSYIYSVHLFHCLTHTHTVSVCTVWKAPIVLDSDTMDLAVKQVVGLWVAGRQRRREMKGGFTGKSYFKLLHSH